MIVDHSNIPKYKRRKKEEEREERRRKGGVKKVNKATGRAAIKERRKMIDVVLYVISILFIFI